MYVYNIYINIYKHIPTYKYIHTYYLYILINIFTYIHI